MPSECRSCRGRIIWAKTANGRVMPLDADPSPTLGNFVILKGVAVSADNPEVLAKGPPYVLYRSHFATCPNAKQHRKPQ